jgi:ubiquinone/menaquinone biosynthesis C-methylase UbiE
LEIPNRSSRVGRNTRARTKGKKKMASPATTRVTRVMVFPRLCFSICICKGRIICYLHRCLSQSMNDFSLLIDLHRHQQRQGPGGVEETRRAIALTGMEHHKDLNIADIGCGTGAQTLTLAESLDGHITAVDLFPEFLEELEARASKKNLKGRISVLQASMEKLPFEKEEFDLIWSEGAIYLMGFEEGLKTWSRFLKPGGIMAVSDIAWLTEKRPAELEEYWVKECPGVDTLDAKQGTLVRQGYNPLGHFVLPEKCWIDHYYKPLQENYQAFLERQGHSQAARQLVEQDQQEYEMYLKYKKYYSYGFFVAKKM